jgi:hypothetical protein
MNDRLQATNNFPQDYDDLISYPSASDDLRALSRTLRVNLTGKGPDSTWDWGRTPER